MRAQARWVHSSARKARLVTDLIRGRSVPEARTILAFSNRAVAKDVEKVLRSAVANAESRPDLHWSGDTLVVVDGVRRRRPDAEALQAARARPRRPDSQAHVPHHDRARAEPGGGRCRRRSGCGRAEARAAQEGRAGRDRGCRRGDRGRGDRRSRRPPVEETAGRRDAGRPVEETETPRRPRPPTRPRPQRSRPEETQG